MKTRLTQSRSQHGAVLVEFAFIFPFLLLLVVGSVDIGGAANASFTAASSIQTAARTASAIGISPNADHELLVSLSASLGSGNLDDLVKVVVYEADTADAEPDPACLSNTALISGGSAAGTCNVYSAATVNAIALDPTGSISSFANPTCAGQNDRFWCPSTRENTQNATSHGGLDHLGVYIEIEHTTTSGLFTDHVTITDHTTSQIQPFAGS